LVHNFEAVTLFINNGGGGGGGGGWVQGLFKHTFL